MNIVIPLWGAFSAHCLHPSLPKFRVPLTEHNARALPSARHIGEGSGSPTSPQLEHHLQGTTGTPAVHHWHTKCSEDTAGTPGGRQAHQAHEWSSSWAGLKSMVLSAVPWH